MTILVRTRQQEKGGSQRPEVKQPVLLALRLHWSQKAISWIEGLRGGGRKIGIWTTYPNTVMRCSSSRIRVYEQVDGFRSGIG